MGSKVWEPPKFGGLGEIEELIEEFEEKVPGEVRIQALDIVLKATLVRWWGAHIKKYASVGPSLNSDENRVWMGVRRNLGSLCGRKSPFEHIDICVII